MLKEAINGVGFYKGSRDKRGYFYGKAKCHNFMVM